MQLPRSVVPKAPPQGTPTPGLALVPWAHALHGRLPALSSRPPRAESEASGRTAPPGSPHSLIIVRIPPPPPAPFQDMAESRGSLDENNAQPRLGHTVTNPERQPRGSVFRGPGRPLPSPGQLSVSGGSSQAPSTGGRATAFTVAARAPQKCHTSDLPGFSPPASHLWPL